MSQKVMLGMSGGVDSSAAAVLLLRQGYDVCGATLRLFTNEDIGLETASRTCCSLRDVEDARSVAHRLGFEHFVFNFGDRFREEVIDRFAHAYQNGQTPNPCIDCNRYIKFDRMLARARLLGMDYIATGHYAQVEFDAASGRYLLKKSKDRSKDQTYVLYALTQDQLAHTLFPLGGMEKSEVRALAEARGLVKAQKADSQDICFVPDGDYAAFLENVIGIPPTPGNFVDTAGKVLGKHRGILHYTIGQRKGLGLSFDRPKYVLRKDAVTGDVVLGDHDALFCDRFTVRDVNLISIPQLTAPMQAAVKARYSQHESPAMLLPLEDGRIEVQFDTPQRAITPGQAAVFYDGDLVIGGGTIE